jgi:hypothetical protein
LENPVPESDRREGYYFSILLQRESAILKELKNSLVIELLNNSRGSVVTIFAPSIAIVRALLKKCAQQSDRNVGEQNEFNQRHSVNGQEWKVPQ